MISCLTVTHPGHRESLELAIRDFGRQTYQDCELVIVHDGDGRFHDDIKRECDRYEGRQIRVLQESAGKTLGELRNLAVDFADGDLVCQWDDDDRYHSERLARQHELLVQENSRFCFMTDQLHWFAKERVMFWDDWDVETWPMNLIQGTLLGFKADLPPYPNLARGEDSPVVARIVQNGVPVSQLKNEGYLYIYVFNGLNAWDELHHKAISAWKRLDRNRLVENRSVLLEGLLDYGLGCEEVVFLHEQGRLVLDLAQDSQ